MKVKELISILQTLDPDRTIWQEYDGSPQIPAVVTAKVADMYPREGLNNDDYAIIGINEGDFYMYHTDNREYVGIAQREGVKQVEEFCEDYPYKGEKFYD